MTARLLHPLPPQTLFQSIQENTLDKSQTDRVFRFLSLLAYYVAELPAVLSTINTGFPLSGSMAAIPAERAPRNKYHGFAETLNDCVYLHHKVISLWPTYKFIIGRDMLRRSFFVSSTACLVGRLVPETNAAAFLSSTFDHSPFPINL